MKRWSSKATLSLTALSLMIFTGCPSGYHYPDHVPQDYSTPWWADPVTKKELDLARATLLREFTMKVTRFNEEHCSPFPDEMTGKHLDEPIPEAPTEDWTGEINLEISSTPLAEPEASVLSDLCSKAIPETACFKDVRDKAIKGTEEHLQTYPPSLQVQILNAYRAELLIAVDFVSQSPSVEEGLRSYLVACERGDTPLPAMLRDEVIPALREQWDWNGERGSTKLAREPFFDGFFFETCATVQSMNRRAILGLTTSLRRCE